MYLNPPRHVFHYFIIFHYFSFFPVPIEQSIFFFAFSYVFSTLANARPISIERGVWRRNVRSFSSIQGQSSQGAQLEILGKLKSDIHFQLSLLKIATLIVLCCIARTKKATIATTFLSKMQHIWEKCLCDNVFSRDLWHFEKLHLQLSPLQIPRHVLLKMLSDACADIPLKASIFFDDFSVPTLMV